MASKKKDKSNEPAIQNRKARHDYHIESTLVCGIKLVGTEVKSVRAGQVSLAEGFVRANESPLGLTLHGVHIAEYPPAGEHRQHDPQRNRILLAHKKEIRKLADRTRAKGTTLIPLKMFFEHGLVKLQIGIGIGKRKADKRRDIDAREARRDIDRAMAKSRR